MSTEEMDPTAVTPNDGSLAARMQARAAQLEQEQSEVFDLTGYEGVLSVELRPLGYTQRTKINAANEKTERNATTRGLYNMADQLVRATIAFYDEEGGQRTPLHGDTWVTLARRMPNAPEAPTPRQALLFLLGERFIETFYAGWLVWANRLRPDVDEEVGQDFDMTG